MTAIGETLRRERLRRNLDLQTISRELKISPKLLEAIEAEKFDCLPGGVFAKAFVRQYARLLGLDEEEMAEEVQRILQPPPAVPSIAEAHKPSAQPIQVPRVEEWETVGDSRFKWSSPLLALALVVVVMMACAGVYSWWQRTRHVVSAHVGAPSSATAPPSLVPAPPQAPPQTQAPVPAQPAEQAQAAPAPPPAESPAAGSSAASQATASRSAAADPVAAPASKLPPPQPSDPNAAVRVELVADEAVWVLREPMESISSPAPSSPIKSAPSKPTASCCCAWGMPVASTLRSMASPSECSAPKARFEPFSSLPADSRLWPRPSRPRRRPILADASHAVAPSGASVPAAAVRACAAS